MSGEVQLKIVNINNALKVVDIILELPPIYTLEDIIRFLGNQKLLAVDKVVLLTEHKQQLSPKLTLKDILKPGSNHLTLLAKRAEGDPVSHIPIHGPPRQLENINEATLETISTLPRSRQMMPNISQISESLVDSEITLIVAVVDLYGSYELHIRANGVQTLQQLMPRIFQEANKHNKSDHWQSNIPYKLYLDRKPLSDETLRMDSIPGLINGKFGRIRLEMVYQGGS